MLWRLRLPILYGIASGTLLVLSLPKPDIYPLAWLALVPLLITIARESNPRRIMASSYTAGLIFFSGTFYWITETMVTFGGLSVPLAVGVGVLFAVTYALYFVLFGVGLYVVVRRLGSRGVFFAAPVWVTVELLRAHLFSGFPWMLSGYALVPFSGILQVAAWTGVYGLSFIATAVNSVIAYGAIHRSKTCIAVAGAHSALSGVVAGFLGSLIGCFGGFQARTRLVKALHCPDYVVAIVEDIVTIGGSLYVVTRF